MQNNYLLVVYDLETNGFAGVNKFSKCHRILEFAARFGPGENQVFTSYVNTGQYPIHPFSTKIHGITRKDTDDAPGIHDVWQKFKDMSNMEQYDKVYMVAHNGKYFDEIMMRKSGIFEPNIVWLDSLIAARATLKKCPGFSLGQIYTNFTGKQLEGAHSAKGDVDALWTIVTQFIIPKLSLYKWEILQQPKQALNKIKYLGKYRLYLLRQHGIRDIESLKRKKNLYNFVRLSLKAGDEHSRFVCLGLDKLDDKMWQADTMDDVDTYVTAHDKSPTQWTSPAFRGFIKTHNN